jgi:hypothetical protein
MYIHISKLHIHEIKNKKNLGQSDLDEEGSIIRYFCLSTICIYYFIVVVVLLLFFFSLFSI